MQSVLAKQPVARSIGTGNRDMRKCIKHYKCSIDTIMEREKGMNIVRAISRIFFYFRRYSDSGAYLRIVACAIIASALSSPLFAANTIVRMETNVGAFNIELYDAQAPLTVTNFLNYVNRGDYRNTVIHRSVPGFIIQGGGYVDVNVFGLDFFFDFPNDPPVQNEFDPSRSNVRGTIAMAKLGGDPNSATSEWFFNLSDNNAANLDYQNGGFTVFGRVLDSGMDIVDAIANLPIQSKNVSMTDGTVKFFGELPVTKSGNFVLVNRICINNDGDGACPETEDLAPGGDGNGDRIPDRDQANVTTIKALLGGTATFAAEAAMTLNIVDAADSATIFSRMTTFKSPPDQSVYFNNGMFTLKMTGAMGSAGHIVTLYDGAATRPNRYYAYGKTPDNKSDHWYDFTFDGETGAEIISDRIILHFVDGKRGDDDLDPNNGSITHTGAQAVVTENANSSSQAGGGCSIVTTPSQTSRGGDWIVVSLFLALLALVRRRNRNGRTQRSPR
jgi:MYXO-CTERM domain-containing protein